MNSEFIAFKEEHYREDDYRKLRDKYVSLKKEANKFMESGNISKFDGELSKKFSTLLRIIDEENTNENERNSKKEAEIAQRNWRSNCSGEICQTRCKKNCVSPRRDFNR